MDEKHVVVMFGGLHIEMAALKALGKWINGSGLIEALANASVASSGVAESFLTASHVTHQVTAAALHILALDSHNYARWLSVHYRELCELPTKHPTVFAEFMERAFVVHKTKKLFSSIALDHAHEQINAVVKGDGGAVGLTKNPAALRRWMVAGPELSRIIEEFEVIYTVENSKHHEQTPAIQDAFAKDVVNLVSSIEDLDNHFDESGEELVTMHTKEIMSEEVVNTIRNARNIGEQQLQTFLKERFKEKKKPLSEPIKKNNFPLLNNKTKKVRSKDKTKVAVLGEDCALFSRLYIACQNRDGNLEDFFKFENQPCPPPPFSNTNGTTPKWNKS